MNMEGEPPAAPQPPKEPPASTDAAASQEQSEAISRPTKPDALPQTEPRPSDSPSANESVAVVAPALVAAANAEREPEESAKEDNNDNAKQQSEDGPQMMEQKEDLAPAREKKVDILSLVCDESMPVFNDNTIPAPVPRVSRPLVAPSRSMQPVTTGVRGKKRTAEGSFSLAPGGKRTAHGLTNANAISTARLQDHLPVAPEVAFLDKYGPYLTYDWSELKLDTVNGSSAWNKALRDKLLQDPSMGSVPQVSSVDVLQWVLQLQAQSETIPPHPLSYLRQVVTRPKWENERDLKLKIKAMEAYARLHGPAAGVTGAPTAPSAKDKPLSDDAAKHAAMRAESVAGATRSNSSAPPPPVRLTRDSYDTFTTSVARAYQDCLLQDVTDYRPELECLRPHELVERMQQLEARAAVLHERGVKVKQLAIWDKTVI